MNCRFCGTELPDTAKFCAACGNSLTEEQAAAADADTASASPIRKGRAALVIGACVVAAAVVVGGGWFVSSRAGVRKFFMGEERYARAVFMDTLGEAAGCTDMLSYAFSELNYLSEALGEADSAGQWLPVSLAAANSALGAEGLTLTTGADIRPSDDIYAGLADMAEESGVSEESLRGLTALINSYNVSVSEKTGEEAYEFAASFGTEKDALLKTTMYYGENGEAYIAFPDAVKGALMVELEELPELPEAKEDISVDLKQLAALASQLEEVFDEYYSDAEVSVERDTLKISGAAFDGLCSEIVFEADDMHDMLEDMIDILSENDYLCDLLEDSLDGFDYEDDLISELESFIRGMDESDVEFCFRGYVTSGNKLAGVELSMYDDDNEIELSAMNTSEHFAAGLAVDTARSSGAEMFLVADKTSATAGTAVFELTATDKTHFELSAEYSGIGTHKAFGQRIPVGTVKLILDDKFVETFSDGDNDPIEIGDKSFEMDDIMSGAAFTFSLSSEGKGVRFDAAFECEELGYYGAYLSAEPASGKVASGKFSDKNVIVIEEIKELKSDEAIEYIEQVAFDLAEKVLVIPELSEILDENGLDDADDLIEAVTGGYDVDEYIKRNVPDGVVTTTMVHPVEY
ncbi:MAG: zinc ribbon domain-containing protein [Oscillospiraceae bacterium]|nr:zinc ribbon domain-containing protein [Oscillospiraceae bacterium]